MNDEIVFDIQEEKGQVITSPAPAQPQGKVIMRVLHTRTEIKIYPNGTTYQNSKSWFEGAQYEVKKKEPKKKAVIKEVTLQQKEEY